MNLIKSNEIRINSLQAMNLSHKKISNETKDKQNHTELNLFNCNS